MIKIKTFVPLATVIGGFVILIIDGFVPEFNPNEGMFTALIYAGLGASAAVGFAKYFKRNKQ